MHVSSSSGTYRRWIVLAAFVCFGISVGIPYYGMPFFYDYLLKELHWTRPEITLGFPLGALLTLWIGPVLLHRYSPRKMILVGTFFTFAAFLGFGLMGTSLFVYYLLWTIYRGGNIFCGPIPYQVILSEWFHERRGLAMAIAYLGVGVLGGISAKWIAQPLTEAYGFRAGLIGIGVLMFLTWPLAIFVLKDRPTNFEESSDRYQRAGNSANSSKPIGSRELLSNPAFWLLLVGSFCSIGSIGAINQHMKLIFLDQFQRVGTVGANLQTRLDAMFSTTLLYIMLISNAGRLLMGFLADHFSKKFVMVVTYFLVALSIPLIWRVAPPNIPYAFAVLFGLGMGADYMMIPLVVAEQFGLTSLTRIMAIILPFDTIAQACVPYAISWLREARGNYDIALTVAFGVALVGAIAVLMLPKPSAATATRLVSS